MFRVQRFAFLVILAVAMVVSCKPSVPKDEIAAKVNGEVITKADYEAAVARAMERYKNQQLPPGVDTRIKQSVLRRMIDDMVIAQRAKKEGISVPDSEVDEQYNEKKSRFQTEDAFQRYLTTVGNTEESMRDDIRKNLTRDRLVEKISGTLTVTDEEIKLYYDENPARFTEREAVNAARILIRTAAPAAEADKATAKRQAEKVRGLATKAGADFAALATEYSDGPEKQRGGDLGWVNRGRMPPEFDNVVFGLAAGEVSPIIETALGYEIVKVTEKRAETVRPFDEVKESIRTSVEARKRNDARRTVLKDMREGAQIETLIEFEAPPPIAVPGAPGGVAGVPGTPNALPPGVAVQPGAQPARPPVAGSVPAAGDAPAAPSDDPH